MSETPYTTGQILQVDRMAFLHNDDPATMTLRGGPAFEKYGKAKYGMVPVKLTSEANFPELEQHQVVFVTCPGNPLIADWIHGRRGHRWPVMIVDVPGPILKPDQLLGEVAQDYWARPETHQAALRAITSADMVTTSDDITAMHILEHQDVHRSVYVLPNLRVDVSEWVFIVQFDNVIRLAFQNKLLRHEREGASWVQQFRSQDSQDAIRDFLRKDKP
jgi:hypothetical protein